MSASDRQSSRQPQAIAQPVAATEVPSAAATAADGIAAVLIEGFDRHYRLFRAASAEAKERFDRAAWGEVQAAVQERIEFYDLRVRECVDRLRAEFDVERLDMAVWQEAKLRYIGLLVDHPQPELAETFFNSVITRILHRSYVHNDLIFVRATISTADIESDPPIYRSYYPNDGDLRQCFERVFTAFGWRRPFADLDRDVEMLVAAVERRTAACLDASRAELPGRGSWAPRSTATRPHMSSARS